jgi:hypothetical protein
MPHPQSLACDQPATVGFCPIMGRISVEVQPWLLYPDGDHQCCNSVSSPEPIVHQNQQSSGINQGLYCYGPKTPSTRHRWWWSKYKFNRLRFLSQYGTQAIPKLHLWTAVMQAKIHVCSTCVQLFDSCQGKAIGSMYRLWPGSSPLLSVTTESHCSEPGTELQGKVLR